MQRARNDLPTSHMESLTFYLESVGVGANQGGGDLVRTLFKILGRGHLNPEAKDSIWSMWSSHRGRTGAAGMDSVPKLKRVSILSSRALEGRWSQ